MIANLENALCGGIRRYPSSAIARAHAISDLDKDVVHHSGSASSADVINSWHLSTLM